MINASRHDYVRGEQAVGRHRYEDVAWIQLIWFQQPQMYLLPAAWLILDILGWERDGEGAALLRFGEFRGAVARGFAAGYGQSSDAQRDASAYLAEGIARYLTAKGALNVADPRLQKLLAATVFDPGAYKSPPGEDGGG